MTTIVTRAGKGSALTHAEVDANFVNLNNDKVEASQTVTLTNKTISGSSNTLTNIGNASLTNSSVTIGSTSVSLGSTASSVSGLTLSSPTVSGGSVDNATVGATTPSTGAFTTLSSSSTTTLNGTTIPSSKTLVDTNSSQTLTNKTLTTPVINGFTGDTSAINIGSGQLVKDIAGNLGVGVTSPACLLDLSSSSSRVVNINSSAAGGVGVALKNSGTDIGYIGSAKYTFSATLADVGITTAGATNLCLGTNNTERLRIDSNGNVGIGYSNPATFNGSVKLAVGSAATTTTSSAITVYSGTATYGGIYFADGTVGTDTYRGGVEYNHSLDALLLYSASAERMRIDSSGTLTSQPTYDNTASGSTVVVTSAGLIRRTSSSIKYKKDVEDLDTSLAANAIDNLRPVWYRTKNAEGDDKATWSHVGLIAEEVHEVEPRLVRYRTVSVKQVEVPVLDDEGNPVLNEDGTPQVRFDRVETELETPEPEDVDYARLSVLLLAEVKSLKSRIAALESK